jgi:transcriptional regulator NrdR family protein
MMCPVCQSDTSVKDSRLQENGSIKRRRVCVAGHSFSTWETTARPDAWEKRREGWRAWAAKQKQTDPEAMRARWRRSKRRQMARAEAAATGRPVEAIYQAWGIA